MRRENFQKRGLGKALLQATENAVKAIGVAGMVARGIPLPFWMKASWFRKQGYIPVDKQGFLEQVLFWKSFAGDTIPPKWIKPKKKPEMAPGKAAVTASLNGWGPSQNLVFEKAGRATSGFGDKVMFRGVDTFNRELFLKWGMADALFIDTKQMPTEPPPSYKKVKRIITQRVRKLWCRAD